MVGFGTAAVVGALVGAPHTPALWVGTAVACILPDLDLASELVGKKGPQFHRNASHSLILLGGLIGLAMVAVRALGIPVDAGQGVAWIAALVSHPLLDVLATGPQLGSQGYGIALFWPISKRRFYIKRPLYETMDLSKVRSLGDLWEGVRPELVMLGPVTVAALVFAAFI